MLSTLTESVQNRDDSAPFLQVLGPKSIQRDEEQRLTLKATTGGENVIRRREDSIRYRRNIQWWGPESSSRAAYVKTQNVNEIKFMLRQSQLCDKNRNGGRTSRWALLRLRVWKIINQLCSRSTGKEPVTVTLEVTFMLKYQNTFWFLLFYIILKWISERIQHLKDTKVDFETSLTETIDRLI